MNEFVEKVIRLVKDAGYDAHASFDGTKVNVINKKNELIGQFSRMPNQKMWFSVFDTDAGEIRPEGGECALDVKSIQGIVEEFRYR